MATSSSRDSQPVIGLLALDRAETYLESTPDLDAELRRHANVQQAATPAQARALFRRSPPPAAILAADGGLTLRTNAELVAEASAYVQAGGTLVCMGLFSSFTRPPAVGALFSRFGLPWRSGSYHRTTFALNPRVGEHFDSTALSPQYSQKALHLAGVAPADAVYLATDESRIESLVFAPTPIDDVTETPAAFARVGQGMVGYIGDVNGEEETTAVVVRMCGLGL